MVGEFSLGILEVFPEGGAIRKLPVEFFQLAASRGELFAQQVRRPRLPLGTVGSLTLGRDLLLQALEILLMRIACGAVELELL